ncbi:MAG: ATP-binding cassette domain-containing protein, partial [Mesorhizobium sp.]
MSFLELTDVHKHYGPVAALAGFEPPDRGRIVLDGEVLANGGAAVPAYRRGIGVVAQDGALFPHLTIAANIGFGLRHHEDKRSERIVELAYIV